MRPSLQQLVQKFSYFNQLIFDGVPRMKLTTDIYRGGCTTSNIARDPSGRLSGIDWTIRISVRFDKPEIYYDSVLVHEMIHYYIGYTNLPDDSSHGRIFVRMMNDINEKYGLDIKVSGNLSDVEISQFPAHQRFFCIAQMADGQTAIQVAAKNKVRQLCSLYESLPDIRIAKWFTSTNPLLGTFPVTSGPYFTFIDEASVPALLTGAVQLTL